MNDEMQIDCCPVCKKPCHATEGDEMGRHPKCQTAPKLTEAQRNVVRYVAGLPITKRLSERGWKEAQARGLVRYWANEWRLTDASRAALRGDK